MRARARRLGVALAAVVALALPSAADCLAATASATAARDASLARRGVTLAVKRHWLAPDEAYRYRVDVTRALSDISRLPKLRGAVIAVQLQQVTAMWDSYTKPRALALFSQLEENLDYLETHIIPPGRIDVADDDGVVYRWFPGKGLEFHPLAAFAALNAAALAQDAERTAQLSTALVDRGIPRGNRLIWEYSFNFGFGRPPWASGMAQAVAAQALGRASAVLEDPTLAVAATRAYAAVTPLTMQLSTGPWVRLYGFNREVVLNAQLQAILSLLQYSGDTGDTGAGALAQRLDASAQAMLSRFDTGDWSLYELGGAYATKEYQLFVTQLLAKLAAQTKDPFWIDASQRFHGYYYDPPEVTPGPPPPTIYPQPLDGFLDVAQIPVTLSQNASVTLAVGGQGLDVPRRRPSPPAPRLAAVGAADPALCDGLAGRPLVFRARGGAAALRRRRYSRSARRAGSSCSGTAEKSWSRLAPTRALTGLLSASRRRPEKARRRHQHDAVRPARRHRLVERRGELAGEHLPLDLVRRRLRIGPGAAAIADALLHAPRTVGQDIAIVAPRRAGDRSCSGAARGRRGARQKAVPARPHRSGPGCRQSWVCSFGSTAASQVLLRIGAREADVGRRQGAQALRGNRLLAGSTDAAVAALDALEGVVDGRQLGAVVLVELRRQARQHLVLPGLDQLRFDVAVEPAQIVLEPRHLAQQFPTLLEQVALPLLVGGHSFLRVDPSIRKDQARLLS